MFREGENETSVEICKLLIMSSSASALATKLAHEINPEIKVGCMLAAGQFYAYTCQPADVLEVNGKRSRKLFLY